MYTYKAALWYRWSIPSLSFRFYPSKVGQLIDCVFPIISSTEDLSDRARNNYLGAS